MRGRDALSGSVARDVLVKRSEIYGTLHGAAQPRGVPAPRAAPDFLHTEQELLSLPGEGEVLGKHRGLSLVHPPDRAGKEREKPGNAHGEELGTSLQSSSPPFSESSFGNRGKTER